MRIRFIIFDLDGTLTDPKEGITKSLRHALSRFGIVVNDLEELTRFIGPTLVETFHDGFGLSFDDAQRGIVYYQEYFREKGLYENFLYPGIEGLLADLKGGGKKLAIATFKPTVFAEEVVRHFGIRHHFDAVLGGMMDDSMSKTEIVRVAIGALGDPPLDETVLVGDTGHDRLAAEGNGIGFVGVTYGYGFKDGAAGGRKRAFRLARSIEELRGFLVDTVGPSSTN
jgi:phosphoglycolate phosphatase